MTSSTEASRLASSPGAGMTNGTFFSARVRLARTMRCAIVGSGTRNALAISYVVRPPIRRRVSAARASADSTGWQAMKISRSRSSLMWSSILSTSGSPNVSARVSMSRLTSCNFCSYRTRRRTRSIARCFAVAISQAPGPSGTPWTGHCSSAITRASCASSSAAPTSPVMRARPAMRRGDSIRQTASIAERVASWLSTVGGPHHLKDVGLPFPAGPYVPVQFDEAGGPLDGFFLGPQVVQGVADQLLGLGERAVGHGHLATGQRDPGAGRAGQQPGGVQQDAGLGGLATQLHDRLEQG